MSQICNPVDALRFILAGNAFTTFVSQRTEKRFTYHVEANDKRLADTAPTHFVKVLTAPDHYEYLGCIFPAITGGPGVYRHGKRSSRIGETATSNVAFMWVFTKLTEGKFHPELEVWHEGKCGRCKKRLTVPESIATGLGPECAKKSVM